MKKFLKTFFCFTLLLIVIFSCFLSPCNALELGGSAFVNVRISNPDNVPFGSFQGVMSVGNNDEPLNISYSEFNFEQGIPSYIFDCYYVVQNGYFSSIRDDVVSVYVGDKMADGVYIVCCAIVSLFDVDVSLTVDSARTTDEPYYVFTYGVHTTMMYFDGPSDFNNPNVTFKIVEVGNNFYYDVVDSFAQFINFLVPYGDLSGFYADGYTNGYNTGYTEGHDVGYEDGEQVGFEGGYIQGRVEGEQIGEDRAYSEQISSSWFGDIFKTVFDAVTNWTIYENPYGTFKITFGGVFGAVVGLVCLMAFLKFFAGG